MNLKDLQNHPIFLQLQETMANSCWSDLADAIIYLEFQKTARGLSVKQKQAIDFTLWTLECKKAKKFKNGAYQDFVDVFYKKSEKQKQPSPSKSGPRKKHKSK